MIGVIIALVGTAYSAWTDWKTGYVDDRVSHAMIIAGIILVFASFPLEQAAWFAAIAAGVFALGWAAYLFGQIGGGDVKLFTALALLLPQYPGGLVGAFSIKPVAAPYPFVVSVFVLFGILFTIFVPAMYLARVFKQKEKIKDFKKKGFTGLAYALVFVPLFVYWVSVSKIVAVLFVPAALALALIPFKDDIVRLFFAQKKSVKDLNDEDVLALELIDEKTRRRLGLWRKTFTKSELRKIKQRATQSKIRYVLVCENLPRAVPFIFASLCVTLVFGDLLLWLVVNAA